MLFPCGVKFAKGITTRLLRNGKHVCYHPGMPIHVITSRYEGKESLRLDELLLKTVPHELARLEKEEIVSKSKIRRLIVAGAVSINGRQIRVPSASVSRGQMITIRLDTEKFSFEKQPDDIAFELTEKDVLFEDDAIIVVNKPAGIPTEATMVASRDHLQAAVRRFLFRRAERESGKIANEPYVGVHHRLDRETSGVILFTKTRAVNEAVHAMFLDHTARKEYEALTVKPRVMPHREFSVDNALGRISPKSAAAKWGAVKNGGDRAHTDFILLEPRETFLRIRAMPITGRTHQIRVHLAELGLPLLGDKLYGGPDTIAIPSDIDPETLQTTTPDETRIPKPASGAAAFIRSKEPRPPEAEANRDCVTVSVPRVMLHAAKLTFPHPVTGQSMTVEAPFPDDFLAFIGKKAPTGAVSGILPD
jgi:23S rRNA pseudouridine1911/1915/1917 synthase